MTLTTMTALGYGEVRPLTHAGRVFNSFLIVCSVTAAGFAIATISQALLEFEFGKAFGRRRMERELSKISGHYIICGAGRVGRTVARQLRARDQAVVMIEKDPGRAHWAEEEKIPVVVGNASSEDNLRKARIDTALGFVSAVASDAENIYIVLTARGLRPDIKILARAS
jgi:voltage-gated potassium channel